MFYDILFVVQIEIYKYLPDLGIRRDMRYLKRAIRLSTYQYFNKRWNYISYKPQNYFI